MDCSLLFTRHVEILKQAFSLIPEYLKTDDKSVINYMDWGVQLGRRFRSLKLWFIIRTFGTNGLTNLLREHCRLGREFSAWVDAEKDFECLAPVQFSVVCFRFHPPEIHDERVLEELNSRIIQAVNATGEVYFSHTKLQGKYTLRIAIGNIQTQEKHVSQAWFLIKKEARNIVSQWKVHNG
jgi:aromatic-L-amino-acid decarboxylase